MESYSGYSGMPKKPRTNPVWFICGLDEHGAHKVYKALSASKKKVFNGHTYINPTLLEAIGRLVKFGNQWMPSLGAPCILVATFQKLEHAVEYCRLKNGRRGYWSHLYKKVNIREQKKRYEAQIR